MVNILFIDDNETILEYYKTLLTNSGYNVIPAIDGIQGIKYIREKDNIDVIVTDMQMPPGDWGGLWLIQQLIDINRIPIIVLSEKGGISKAVEAMKMGAKEFVEKAHAENDLIPSIEKVLLQVKSDNRDEKIVALNYYESLGHIVGPIWDRLEEQTKLYLANSENIYHKNIHDNKFDYSLGIIEISKAFELECNNKLIRSIKKFLDNNKRYRINIRLVNGSEIELQKMNDKLTLGQLNVVLNNYTMKEYYKSVNARQEDILRLNQFLYNIRKKYHRNEAAHPVGEVIGIKVFEELRSESLGITCVSPFTSLLNLCKEDR